MTLASCPVFMDENWLKKLENSFQQAPIKPRVGLFVGRAQVGSIDAERLLLLQEAGLLDVGEQGAYLAQDGVDTQLASIAHWLADHGMASPWRNELLSVTDASGNVYGVVERAVVRVLGITTQSVHLLGRTDLGEFWLQERASHKTVDPGQLSALAGGLVSAKENLLLALEREVHEEAGLFLQDLSETGLQGEFNVFQPVDSNVGGYMQERVFWLEREIPSGALLVNQDGEVSGFVKLSLESLCEKMIEGRVASIACLIFAHLFRSKHS